MMNEIQIKERITGITGDDFSSIVLKPFEIVLQTAGQILPLSDYVWVTDAVLTFDDPVDLPKANFRFISFDNWDGSISTRVGFNMGGSTGHHALNPTELNILTIDLTISSNGVLVGDVYVFIRGYQVEIVP